MVLIKYADSEVITSSDVHSADTIVTGEVENKFKRYAENLKIIAPKAKDFLYFVAVMMHSAERNLLDKDGKLKEYNGQPVTASWEKVTDHNGNESLKWVCSDPNIKPYKNNNCFVPGTQILMSDGTVKNIEDIDIGDEVITHLGNKKKVLNTFVTQYNGELLKINTRNEAPLLTTPEHPFYRLTVKHPNKSTDTQKHLLRQANTSKEFEFVEAKDLSKYDILSTPVIKCDCPNEITVNQARLLGLFAAEGSFGKKYNRDQSVIFTFSIHEKDTLAKFAANLLCQEFSQSSVNVYTREAQGVSIVTATGKGITDFFRKHVGEYSLYKTLSPQLLYNKNADIREQFVIGWLEGDGHVAKDYGQIIGITVSKNLASQIRIMLNSTGIHSSLRITERLPDEQIIINKKYGGYNINDVYRVEIPFTFGEKLIKKSEYLNFTNKPKAKYQNVYYENYHIKSIKSIDNKQYNGFVYNFEVEDDNSYIANNIAVHNCDIFPESELKLAHKKWCGKPLCIDHKSSSVDHTRGLIIDTIYDEERKRVIALCALDKKNYPDLAHKVATQCSAAVSMGTAVGKAICTDCHRVASRESEFCDHMRHKSGYGEVNLDLSPIELSLVVNGADPDAKIKHIIAKDLKKAADNIEEYIEKKSSENSLCMSKDELEDVQSQLKSISERVDKLVRSSADGDESQDISDGAPYGVTRSAPTMQESEMSGIQNPWALPEPFPTVRAELKDVQVRVANIQENLDKLTKGTTMANDFEKKGYYLGGGGVNEPTPGKPKYDKDPMNEKVRLNEDKHMNGQSPFPGVGPVDGMHPGTSSSGEGELERKKRLKRAEMEEKQMKRKAALDTIKAYYLGGGGPNEPTPGKVKYPNETDYKKIRDNEDKQMTGQAPFPDVGPVDGLHPSPASADEKDELKRKQMLQRASLKAKFIKAATPEGGLNKADSAWQVYAGKNLILSATVNEITGGKADHLYNGIATQDYGRYIIDSIRSRGFDQTKKILKSAQEAPMMEKDIPASPPDAGGPAPMPADMGGDMDMPEDPGIASPEEGAAELASKVRELAEEAARSASDLVEALGPMKDDMEELSDVEPADEAAFAAEAADTKTLRSMRKSLASWLIEAMEETTETLKSHSDELKVAADVCDGGFKGFNSEQKKYATKLTNSAITHAKTTLADARNLMSSFVKYASGTYNLTKQAQNMEMPYENPVQSGQTTDVKPGQHDPKPTGEVRIGDVDYKNVPDPLAADTKKDEMNNAEDDKKKVIEFEPEVITPNDSRGGNKGEVIEFEPDVITPDESNAEGPVVQVPEGTKASDLPPNTALASSGFDLSTKEGRAAARVKIAQKGMKFSDKLREAHPKGSHQVENFDTKPTGDLGVVEDLEGTHSKMVDNATKDPQVRKQAKQIAQLVATGELAKDDVDGLTSLGIDPAAVKYYKQYWGEAKDKDSSEFANKLTQEHAAKKKASENENFEVKVKRAYDLAYEMKDRGIIKENQVKSQVEEIMKWNDASFDSCKRAVLGAAVKKTAASVPEVGWLHSGEVLLPEKSASAATNGGGSSYNDMLSMFNDYFKNHKPRSF